jgi:hypothetical protein
MSRYFENDSRISISTTSRQDVYVPVIDVEQFASAKAIPWDLVLMLNFHYPIVFQWISRYFFFVWRLSMFFFSFPNCFFDIL